jgi:hypothetical protein
LLDSVLEPNASLNRIYIMDNQLQPPEVDKLILVIRGQSVMLDIDLARIYGVSTKRLNEQVRRNLERFPEDFMFRLSPEEARALIGSRSQSGDGRIKSVDDSSHCRSDEVLAGSGQWPKEALSEDWNQNDFSAVA